MARRRRSRRDQHSWHIWIKLFKLALLVAVIGAASFYAYQTGQRLALGEVDGLRQKVAELTTAEEAARDQSAKLATALNETKQRADDLQAKYQQVAPSDDIKEVMGLVRAKLASGLDVHRLAFVIQHAEPPRHCGEATTKRFMVRTAKVDGAATWVRFAELITVTAQGVATNPGVDRYFDPEKPVVITFTAIGGKEVQVEGKLPLQHSMVVKNGEYRFTVVPGARGFIEVTGDRCDYRG